MMVQQIKRFGIVALVATSACAAAQQQVVPQEDDGVYVDPWGTPVAWSAVPAGSSGATPTPVAGESEEAKPKAEEETPAATSPPAESDAPAGHGDLGSEDDGDE